MSIAETEAFLKSLYEKHAKSDWWPKGVLPFYSDRWSSWCVGGFGGISGEAGLERTSDVIFAALHKHVRAKGWNPQWGRAGADGVRLADARSNDVYGTGPTDLARLIDAAEKANLL